jgi:parallel beta-helix repeat protein
MCKKVLCSLLFIALFLLFTTMPAVAQKGKVRPTVWDVYPAMDRLAIQGVVNSASNGDTIYFHAGEYDWSGAVPIYPRWANEGAINIIDKTLTIKGEPGNLIKGPDSPIIDGWRWGLHAFQVLDEDTDNDVTFVGLNIQHFMRGLCVSHNIAVVPNVTEYSVPNARNVTITDCAISDIANQPILLCDVTGNILIQNNQISQCARGIWLAYRGPDFAYWQPNKSSVSISRNIFTSCRDWGIYAERTKNSRFENNSISTTPDPLLLTYGIYVGGAKKGTVISANSISNYKYGICVEGWSSPPDSAVAENMVIVNNKVSSVFPKSCFGIVLNYDLSSRHTITRNEINLTSQNGVGIYSEVNHSFYEQNKISGSGFAAVYLAQWDYSQGTGLPTYAHHELFAGNDVSQFTPSAAHYYLDYGTHDNKVIGFGRSTWTYMDFGVNNIIIGGTNITFATIQALSAVTAVSPKPGDELREARKNIIF